MIEGVRKKLLKNLIITLVIGAFLEILLLGFLNNENYIIIATLILFITIGIASSFSSKYKNFYKNEIIKPLFEKYSLTYDPDMGLDENLALSSGLLPEYDEYNSSDLIKGEGFEAANVTLYRYRRSTDREDREVKETLFSGMMVVTKSERDVKTPFLIKNNSFYLCKVLPFCADKERQRLDDNEFEKYFDVFGGDMVEVREILTHNIMESLVNLKKLINLSEISLIGKMRFATLERFSLFLIPSIFKKFDENSLRISERNIQNLLNLVNFLKKL